MPASADRGTDATAAGWPALEAVRGCARRGGARRAGDVSPSGTLAVLTPIRARSRSLSRAALAIEAIRVVAPMAIEAAREAERMHSKTQAKRQEMVELELQQMRYEASLAERRYAACDPENRLIAAQLEKSWDQALQRVAACEARIQAVPEPSPNMPNFTDLAMDLEAAWNAPATTMRTRQRLLRTLVTDIVAGVDKTAREVVLVIHWRGGQHSQLRVQMPASGDHGVRTPEQAANVIRSMAGS